MYCPPMTLRARRTPKLYFDIFLFKEMCTLCYGLDHQITIM